MPTKADTSVKWFHSDMPDAPALFATPGSLVAVLDACLVNGFGVKTIDTLTVNNGIATATIGAGHAFERHAVIAVSGVTGALAALNDQWRIESAPNATTLTFAAPSLPNGTATGAITALRPGAGWQKPFSATNRGVYKPTVTDAAEHYLYVNDEGDLYAHLRGYEHMTGPSGAEGTWPFPADGMAHAGWCRWHKKDYDYAPPKSWIIFSDAGFFYVFLRTRGELSGQYNYDCYYAGCIDAFRALDTSAFVITSSHLSTGISGYPQSLTQLLQPNTVWRWFPRSLSGGGVPTAILRAVPSSAFGTAGPSYPGLADGGLHVSPVYIVDGIVPTSPIRGALPGGYAPLHNLTKAHAAAMLYQPFENLPVPGRALMIQGNAESASQGGFLGVDIVGPWR